MKDFSLSRPNYKLLRKNTIQLQIEMPDNTQSLLHISVRFFWEMWDELQERKKYNTQENRRQGEELLTNEKISTVLLKQDRRCNQAQARRKEGRSKLSQRVSLKLSSESETVCLSMEMENRAEIHCKCQYGTTVHRRSFTFLQC